MRAVHPTALSPQPFGVQDAFRETEVRRIFGHLGQVGLLRDFEPAREPLGRAEMLVIVEQATALLSGYYVHLPVKRALHAADPLSRLQVLSSRLWAMRSPAGDRRTEAEFHEEMTDIFTSLRDLHTIYILPEPYRSHIAFLPFLVERAVDDDAGERYLLTKVLGVDSPSFPAPARGDERRDVVITHFNGVEIGRAVARNGELNAGSNRAARLAKGLERLTFRWLGVGARPDEDWVVVSYLLDGDQHHLRFPWLVLAGDAERPAPVRRGGGRRSLALEQEGDWLRRTKRQFFAVREEAPGRGRFAEQVRFRAYRSRRGRDVGHLRIFSFDVQAGEVAAFADHVRRLLDDAPPAGLVIDIRGNPGGDLVAAQKLLQLISPHPIVPQPVEFANTVPSARLARRMYPDEAFAEELGLAAETGAAYIRSPPVVDPREYNDIGRVYAGPVVLIVDALSYSAGDIFAAGFRDHDLGEVVGTAAQTGGGGGNVWTYDHLRQAASDLKPLPREASFDVAVRRSTRVRDKAGIGLEDLGVTATRTRALTSRDLLGRNEDLLEYAVEVLERRR